MSGIDNPIKKLKPLSLKDAEITRAPALKKKQEEARRIAEKRQKEHEKQIEITLPRLRAEFVKSFEQYKSDYAQGITDFPILVFRYKTAYLPTIDKQAVKKACDILITELKDTLTVKVARYDDSILYLEVVVVDEIKEDK